MNSNLARHTNQYEDFYGAFDSPLLRAIRREAYGEDIGQHSWVSGDEVRSDAARLALTPADALLDLGSGPCGPLTLIQKTCGCSATGLELSGSALRAAKRRAAELGVDHSLSLLTADLNHPLPNMNESYDAITAFDVVLHVRDRAQLFREVARILKPGGKFLFTDAGVVSGSISSEEVRLRSIYGHTEFCAVGWNESLLRSTGFTLIETEDRTPSMMRNAAGRLRAMRAHKTELEETRTLDDLESQFRYLEVVIALARRGALSRVMYLAEVDRPRASK